MLLQSTLHELIVRGPHRRLGHEALRHQPLLGLDAVFGGGGGGDDTSAAAGDPRTFGGARRETHVLLGGTPLLPAARQSRVVQSRSFTGSLDGAAVQVELD